MRGGTADGGSPRDERSCREHAGDELSMGEPGRDDQRGERRSDECRQQAVGRAEVRGATPGGTRVALAPVTIDALEIHITGYSGRVEGRRAAGLAEVEITGRLAPE